MSAPSFSPEQWIATATAAYRRGDWVEAVRCFSAARQAFSEAGMPVQSAEAANNLSVTYLQAGQGEQALEAVEGTPQFFLDAGDTVRAAQAHGNLGAALEACGRLELAEPAFRRAIELFESAGDAEQRALSLQALARVQLRRGQAMQALGSMQAGLEGGRRLSPTRRLLRRLLRLPGRILGPR